MSKYIIEIAKEYEEYFKGVLICGIADGKFAVDVIAREDLEELNSDYINEHFSDLQDTAYQKGFEDGKNSIENGCKGCKFESRTVMEEPCKYCSNCHTSKYTPMPKHDDPIKVGDEVIYTTDNITLIATSTYKVGSINLCDGVAKNGRVYSTLIENDRKTGKHYDIASILEAMRQ